MVVVEHGDFDVTISQGANIPGGIYQVEIGCALGAMVILTSVRGSGGEWGQIVTIL
jgi:hypothetical protein